MFTQFWDTVIKCRTLQEKLSVYYLESMYKKQQVISHEVMALWFCYLQKVWQNFFVPKMQVKVALESINLHLKPHYQNAFLHRVIALCLFVGVGRHWCSFCLEVWLFVTKYFIISSPMLLWLLVNFPLMIGTRISCVYHLQYCVTSAQLELLPLILK